MIVLKPPASLSLLDSSPRSVFLAGSIEMDDAPRWQDQLITVLAGIDSKHPLSVPVSVPTR